MSDNRYSRKATLVVAMLLLGALAGLLLATESQGATASHTRNGFVLADGAPLEGATITAFNPDTGEFATETSLEDGFYEFTDLASGHYLFRYSNESYLAQVTSEAVFADGMISLDDVLLTAVATGDATLSGKVTDSDDGSNVTGAAVTLVSTSQLQDTWWNRQAGYSFTTTTDNDGNYSFADLLNESYTLRISTDIHYTYLASVDANTTAGASLTKVNDDYLHYIYVKDERGNTIRDATVKMYERATDEWTDAVKLGGATYLFRPQAGDYDFTAELEGYHKAVWSTTVTGPATHTFNLVPKGQGDAAASYTFTGWENLSYSLSETLKYDQGRTIDSGDVLLTGVIRFDIDRLWGNNDGNVETSEVTAYEAWEEWLGVDHHTAPVTVDGSEFAYAGDYNVTIGGVAGVSGTAVDDAGEFSRTTDLTYDGTVAESDSYAVALEVAYGTDRLAYSYALAWPTNFEAVANTSTSKATVTGEGTGAVAISTTNGSGGTTVTLTVKENQIPTPVIEVTSATTLWNETHVVGMAEQVNFTAGDSRDTPTKFGITQYDWDFDDGSGTQFGETINYTFAAAGSYNVSLTVHDSYGAVNTTSVTVLVDGVDPAADIAVLVKASPGDEGEPYNATASNINEDLSTVVFNGTNSTDADTYIASYAWDFGDNTTDAGSVVNKQYSEPGNYTVVLTVTDAAGNTDTAEFALSVNDITRPEAAFSYFYEEDVNDDGEINATNEVFLNAAKEGVPTTFNATPSKDNYDDVANLTFVWDFGDGTVNVTGQGLDFAIVSHTYTATPEEGYNVVLMVIDRANNTDPEAQNVKVARTLKPDLYVSELVIVTTNPTEGKDVKMTATIGLQGLNVSETFKVGFYYNKVDENHLIANITVNGMTEGIDNTVEINATWAGAKVLGGNLNIYVVVDSGNAIDESTEKNTLTYALEVAKEDEGSMDRNSQIFIGVVVIVAVGAVAYIYRDRLFGKR